jgi:4-amino-4-deoxy-L-arabinose transferase-like glycosyltransferase
MITTLDPGTAGQGGSGGPPAPSVATPTGPGRPGPRSRPEWWALAVLLASSALLLLWDLGTRGWANSYYSAAAQAGTQSWLAALFGSLDPANAITIDKTPGALWPMEIAGRVAGVSPWSMLVPQALMGVATVGVLYAAVRRVAGPGAGLLAGTLFALTPVGTQEFRLNSPDALLTLLMVLAAYCGTHAVEPGRWRGSGTRWMVLAGLLLGFAFLAKDLQMLLVVPGLALVHLWAAPGSARRRIAQVLAGGAGLVVGAGWWLLTASLWPVANRPYLGGTTDNTLRGMLLNLNGLARILGGDTLAGVDSTSSLGVMFAGEPGPFRLFNDKFGGQATWFLPAATVLLLVALWLTRRAPRTDRVRAGLLLWGGWMVVTAATFSFVKGLIHPYYTVALAPGVVALVAIGGTVLVRGGDSATIRATLALAAAGTVVWAWVVLGWSPQFLPWLRRPVLTVGLLGAAALLLPATRSRRPLVLAVALAATMTAPAAYSVQTASTHRDTYASEGGGPDVLPAGGTAAPASLPPELISPELIRRLRQADTRWAAATIGATVAADMQLASGPGIAVFGVGGYTGSDPFPTLDQFQSWVREGRVRYMIVGPPGRNAPGGSAGGGAQIQQWVVAHYPSTQLGERTVYDLRVPVR